jgi:Ca-activated chloride channel family protein
MNRSHLSVVAFLLCWTPLSAVAQGLLIVENSAQQVRLPRPIIIWPHPAPAPTPMSYKIQELSVQAKLLDQVAEVQLSQTFTNTGNLPMEVSFVFPLPYDGAIDRMTLLIDGKEYPAKLLDAAKARQMYEEIVRKNRDPALLEWLGSGLFRTSVFPVPAGASRTVSLRYTQLCREQNGLTDFLFPLSTAKYTSEPIESLDIRVSIESAEDIKNIYSPSHAINIQRTDARHAVVSFLAKNDVPSTDFRLLYDVEHEKLSARVLSYRHDAAADGFFLLLASPQIKSPDRKPVEKTVLLVIDRSGSMSGQKIDQVKAALKDIVNRLQPGDLFNVIAYDDRVEAFRPELQRYTDATRKAALGFVEGLFAGGTTNINAAMQTALGQLQDSTRPNYVIFLTDGLPTAGETNEMRIVANAKNANRVHARIFAFGVGYDVNSRLLDKLVRENFGQSEYVRPNENIEDRVAKLYQRIESPVLTDVRLSFTFDAQKTEDGPPVNRVYPNGSFDLFAGEQLVIVGRYKKPGSPKVTIQGAIAGKPETFEFPATLVDRSADDNFAFVEKLWAIRRVGEILDSIDLNGSNDERIQELVELATRHGILTPYTSFIADESVRLHEVTSNIAFARQRLSALDASSGADGFIQRAMKGKLQVAMSGPAPSAASAELEAFSAAAKPMPAFANVGRESQLAQQTVRQIGARTFYRRDGLWIDSQVTHEQQANPQRIKQFSDEYFKLAERYGRRLSQYLIFDEPVVLTFDSQTYQIEP